MAHFRTTWSPEIPLYQRLQAHARKHHRSTNMHMQALLTAAMDTLDAADAQAQAQAPTTERAS